jgi:hypothetical protein
VLPKVKDCIEYREEEHSEFSEKKKKRRAGFHGAAV